MFSPILQRSVANLSNLHTTSNNCNNNENLKIFLWFSGKSSKSVFFISRSISQQLLERWLFLKANKWDKTIVNCEPEKVMFLDELCKLWYLEHNSRSQLFHHLPLVSVAPLNLPTPYNSVCWLYVNCSVRVLVLIHNATFQEWIALTLPQPLIPEHK